MNVKIFTVIVTFNGSQWIKNCIESIYNSNTKTKIIVVDNSSYDNTLEILEEFDNVKCIPQDSNLGFGKANNIGISYALKKGADYVFLLNQDVFISENTLEHLVRQYKSNSDYGILSPIHLNWEGTQLENYFSRFAAVNMNFYSDYVLKKPLKEIYEVPFVNAAAWLIPQNVLKTVGGFDPVFDHYGEDNNYCQRLQYHGFKIGIVPICNIFHDSIIRKEPKDYLFSEGYYHNEVKNLLLKYADITKNYTNKDFRNVKKHVKKLIFINLLKFKLNHVKGYLKKYRIFERTFDKIKRSRSLNTKKSAHYLEL